MLNIQKEAKIEGIQGKVLVKATITTEGKVLYAEILKIRFRKTE